MSIQLRLILIVAASSAFIAIIGIAMIYQIQRTTEQFDQNIPTSIARLNNATHLNSLAQSIRYYDEVLTQSARNYAFTQDKQWEERYRNAEPRLDAIIQKAITDGDQTDRAFFARVQDANLVLVNMEYTSIDLVNTGRFTEAIQILQSREYGDNKAIYSGGLEDYLAKRGATYEQESKEASEAAILANSVQSKGEELLYQTTNTLIIIIPIIIGVMALVGFRVYTSINNPLQRLVKATDELAKGNYADHIGVMSNDEIGLLARRFEKMERELQNKERIKDEFINIASHELRNPIQPILIYADLAANGDVDKDTALAVILKQAQKLHQLANDILDVSKIDSDNLKLHKKDIKIGDLIEETVKPLRAGLKSDVSIDLDMDENTQMNIDGPRISQVIVNIIHNALKFTESGGIKVRKKTLEPLNGSQQPRMVEIIISDTGRGIPQELLTTLFGKFVTKDIDGKNRGGTGLGLYISQGIIKAHGGDVTAYNNPDKGASFRILLPVV